MIYLSSDFHFSHNKNFVYETRGFHAIEDMNEAIIERFNSVITKEDELYVLGDLCLGGGSAEAISANKALIERLNGTLHIILGNHDTQKRVEMYQKCKNIESIDYATVLKYKKYYFYLSHYPALTSNWDDDKSLKQRMISLCGHTHSINPFKDIDKGPIYHVECDAHNCYPVLLDDIIEEMKSLLDKTTK